MKFRNRFEKAPRVVLACSLEERRTKQEFKDQCDINLIMARYQRTGQLPASAMSAAMRYGDFSQIPSFHEMHDRVMAATDLFNQLPARVRKQYGNDPGAFLAASQTPEGAELLVKLGLATKTPQPAKQQEAGQAVVAKDDASRSSTQATKEGK